MVRHTLKILYQILQDFLKCVWQFWAIIGIKGLRTFMKLKCLKFCQGRKHVRLCGLLVSDSYNVAAKCSLPLLITKIVDIIHPCRFYTQSFTFINLITNFVDFMISHEIVICMVPVIFDIAALVFLWKSSERVLKEFW